MSGASRSSCSPTPPALPPPPPRQLSPPGGAAPSPTADLLLLFPVPDSGAELETSSSATDPGTGIR